MKAQHIVLVLLGLLVLPLFGCTTRPSVSATDKSLAAEPGKTIEVVTVGFGKTRAEAHQDAVRIADTIYGSTYQALASDVEQFMVDSDGEKVVAYEDKFSILIDFKKLVPKLDGLAEDSPVQQEKKPPGSPF